LAYLLNSTSAVLVSIYALLNITSSFWKEFWRTQNIPPCHCP